MLTPYLQVVQGADAQATGLRLLPMIGAMLVSAAVLAVGALLVLLFLPGGRSAVGETRVSPRSNEVNPGVHPVRPR